MIDFINENYLWIRAFHIIFVIAWMAGMLYLPRLYIYHHEVKVGSDEDKRFQMMERKLLRIIINPAMIITFIFGTMLAFSDMVALSGWFHVKGLLLFLMVTAHGFLARWRKAFARGEYPYNAKFFRIFNEVPTILMFGIVIMAVVKPF